MYNDEVELGMVIAHLLNASIDISLQCVWSELWGIISVNSTVNMIGAIQELGRYTVWHRVVIFTSIKSQFAKTIVSFFNFVECLLRRVLSVLLVLRTFIVCYSLLVSTVVCYHRRGWSIKFTPGMFKVSASPAPRCKLYYKMFILTVPCW